jgi:hypothetical protein
MVEKEYPYLRIPAILQYPNETWAAQELRKCAVLYHAARFAGDRRREEYVRKARFLYDAACEDLSTRPSSSLARPLALVLQNGWVGPRIAERSVPVEDSSEPARSFGPPTPRLTVGSVAARTVRELGRAFRESSIRREISWLRSRIG